MVRIRNPIDVQQFCVVKDIRHIAPLVRPRLTSIRGNPIIELDLIWDNCRRHADRTHM